MARNRTARQHSFAIIPDRQKPRSKFLMRQTRKMGFNASELVPIMCEEVLPGDTWQHTESISARLATPIAPLIDDLDLETWYFYVPNRIIWPDWEDFITGTDDTLTVPTVTPVNDAISAVMIKSGGLLDHFGLLPQTFSVNMTFNRLPVDAYFTIYNEWYRDQNLQDPWDWDHEDNNFQTVAYNNGAAWNQMPLRVNKRSDYFTRSLPWPQKGDPVQLPLGSTAPVMTASADLITGAQPALRMRQTDGDLPDVTFPLMGASSLGGLVGERQIDVGNITGGTTLYPTNLYTDLAAATAATINSLRLAAITQQLLELDARGGSRYIENLLAHWSVRASNRSLQRPEYLGGSRTSITINPIAQTAAYDAQPGPTDSNLGNLGAEMHATNRHRSFTYAAEEHGYIIGLAAVRATPTYQQGTRRHWRRTSRLDFWDPIFEGLGEQEVATQEIYQPTNNDPTNDTWGFQERAAEYRYTPNEITGPLRSTATLPLDWWHLSEEFGAEPALNASFITDKTQEVLNRALAVDIETSEQWSCQIIMDILHESVVARMMPAYSVPGIKTF